MMAQRIDRVGGSNILHGMAAGIAAGLLCWSACEAATNGPLRVNPTNPRYFGDASGNVVFLTGSHTWGNLQDGGYVGNVQPFDYTGYLDFLQQHHHNFIRLWRWEMPEYRYHNNLPFKVSTPQPYARTGPGTAGDGGLKFNLYQYDAQHFQRLRDRLIEARDRGIYVSVMLFEGHALQFTSDGWFAHPFNAANNVNGINGDLNGDGQGTETQTLQNAAVNAVQVAYIHKVIDSVNDLDNVLFEVANESTEESMDWQRWVIDQVKAYEATKPHQHPVIFSTPLANVGTDIWNSHADAVSPGTSVQSGGVALYKDNPPANDGTKVVITDTDHLWGCGGTATWVWQSFTRGLNPIYMDPYGDDGGCGHPNEGLRVNMGYALDVSHRVDMKHMVPHNELSTSQYCLAYPGISYVVLIPDGGPATVNLSAVSGVISAEWLSPANGQHTAITGVHGGGQVQFAAPFQGMSVLLLGAGTSACAGDLTGDGHVNIDDLTVVITSWGPCSGACPADLTGDGVVAIDDLTVLILNWSQPGDASCMPVASPPESDPPGDLPPVVTPPSPPSSENPNTGSQPTGGHH